MILYNLREFDIERLEVSKIGSAKTYMFYSK